MPPNRYPVPLRSRNHQIRFFEERKADVRYRSQNRCPCQNQLKMGITGKTLALFNSDNYDSDGDGVSNLERAFGGDSLSNDRSDTCLSRLRNKAISSISPLPDTTPLIKAIWDWSISWKEVRTCGHGPLLGYRFTMKSKIAGNRPTAPKLGLILEVVWNAWFIEPRILLSPVPLSTFEYGLKPDNLYEFIF